MTRPHRRTTGRSQRPRRAAILLGSLLLLVAAGLPAAAVERQASESNTQTTADQDYPLPGLVTGDLRAHDPSMIRTPQGYRLFATHDGVQLRTSPDRVDFQRNPAALSAIPEWVYSRNSGGDVWAPDISFHNGTYWLYYAASSFGSNNSAIGLATSQTAEPGSWQDRGVVYSTTTSADHNAIDPSLLVVGNDWWLSFGSHWSGIKMIRIDPATGMRHGSDRTVHNLASRPSAGGAIEAPYILERGGDFYLFVSFDRCCAGTDSTYRIMVGRADSPTGPYYDRNGTPMLGGGGTQILGSHRNVIGPGGQSVLRDTDGDLLVYHYYDANNSGIERLGVNLLGWDDQGWPYVY
ncbi:arabinan endo-1,5-alpha-L-arabinosidase [Actinoalloteichus hymeniacidonis]|uniref:Glycosyl hydrolase family 43 n=1 Tax=Actinoalloteichus hymeniacidonis TaxID=340345 RepID=A0AAC9HLX1_9PSEU|nr:arabinan endo-1,5-alpha-L-arabinosidase [Actinoalloteichus hymeniacidonis]AOS61613.1 glycosyl hydrolase family 43 [Actinoalloteichus hymeniacidonis]MBB5910377.1 arabinan endo-1,5-alpha-L-arabinosidase [Actinoalloteichus hymeniacidonis]